MGIASRIFNVAPVIKANDQIKDYYKSQFLRKKFNCRSFGHFREKEHENFVKQTEFTVYKKIYQSLVKLRILTFPKIEQSEFTTFWVELVSGTEKTFSTHL